MRLGAGVGGASFLCMPPAHQRTPCRPSAPRLSPLPAAPPPPPWDPPPAATQMHMFSEKGRFQDLQRGNVGAAGMPGDTGSGERGAGGAPASWPCC